MEFQLVGFLLEKQFKGGKSNLKVFFDDDGDEDDDGVKVC